MNTILPLNTIKLLVIDGNKLIFDNAHLRGMMLLHGILNNFYFINNYHKNIFFFK